MSEIILNFKIIKMFKPTANIIPPKYHIDMLDFEDKLTINKY